MSTLILNTKLLKKRVPNISKAARSVGMRPATVFDLCRGKTRIEHTEVRTLKALADLAGCTMDELVLVESEPAEDFATSLGRWAVMPENSVSISGPQLATATNEDEDIAFLKRLPRTKPRAAASPKSTGKYAI